MAIPTVVPVIGPNMTPCFPARGAVACLMVWLWLSRVAWAAPVAWDYRVDAHDPEDLRVDATFSTESNSRLWLADELWPYVHDLQVQGQTVRYRFRLGLAAREQRHYKVASLHQGAILTTPSTFLLRPVEALEGTDYRVSTTGPCLCASSQGSTRSLDHAPAAVLGRFSTRPFAVRGGTVELVYQPGTLQLSDQRLFDWVALSAGALADYYGRLPMERVLLVVLAHQGRGVRGMALGNSVLMLPSASMPAAELREDWTLMHELSHLGLPALPSEHHWLEEGLATYLEPLIRVRAGDFPPEKMWVDLVENLPERFPDEAVKNSHDWNRIYWGGALFWFVGDLRIRLATGKSLETALRAIVAEGGNLTQEWSLEHTLEVADRAVGQPILAGLPALKQVDLREYWRQLGVRRQGERLEFVKAPWSYLRDSLSSK